MRILVVGGTGSFGRTITRLLVADGHHVVIAGRNPEKGRRAVEETGADAFETLDRARITETVLKALAVDLVVDASGPFQEADLSLPRAAIGARIHYLDIADDRAFVARIRTLDKEALANGVIVLSGASSVPTLSTAVAMRQAAGLDVVDRVEISISASSKAAFGNSVLGSMLSGAGRPIANGTGLERCGMTSPRTVTYRNDDKGSMRRVVLDCDVPDHDDIPRMLPDHPSTRFRAGGETWLQAAFMRTIAAAVRRRWINGGRVLLPLARLGRGLVSNRGDGRSAMMVEVLGTVGGMPLRSAWTITAWDGMGPMIPCLAIPALVAVMARGGLVPKAASAAGELTVDEILSRMPSGCWSVHEEMGPYNPIHRSAMGEAYDRLSPAIREMHAPATRHARGRAMVTRGKGPLASIACAMFGFPKESLDVSVVVDFEKDAQTGEETWIRNFGGSRFRSRLVHVEKGVEESFGPFRFRFELEESEASLRMVPVSWRVGRIPLPRRLMPDGIAEERGEDGIFTFDVPIRMPVVGLLVHYWGWMQKR